MPHSKKKKRNASGKSAPAKSYRNTYIMVGVVAAIIIAASGWYVYSTSKTATTTLSYPCTTTSSATTTITPQSGYEYAVLCTSQGSFEIELFQNLTPAAVNNFVSLAKSGFYNNLVWHRIVKGFVIQTGDPTTKNGQGTPCNWGSGGSSTTVPFEYVPSLHNYPGYLAYASSGPKQSASSQFFINLADNSELDDNYTVFGNVVSGMNVVDAIGNLPVTSCVGSSASSPPANPSQAMLISVTVLTT